MSGKNLQHAKDTSSVALGLPGAASVTRYCLRCTGCWACEYHSTTVSQPHLKWSSSDWDRKYEDTHMAQRAYVEEARSYTNYDQTLVYWSLMQI